MTKVSLTVISSCYCVSLVFVFGLGIFFLELASDVDLEQKIDKILYEEPGAFREGKDLSSLYSAFVAVGILSLLACLIIGVQAVFWMPGGSSLFPFKARFRKEIETAYQSTRAPVPHAARMKKKKRAS